MWAQRSENPKKLFVQGAIQVVDNVAALREITPTAQKKIRTAGVNTPGDGGGGDWYAVTGAAAGTYTDNTGTVIVPTGGDGSAAWLRDYKNKILVKWFGSIGDGITDDSAQLQKALTESSIKNTAVKGKGLEQFKVTQTILNNGIRIEKLSITSDDAQCLYTSANAEKVELENNEISAQSGIAIQHNSQNVKGLRLKNNRITAKSYGILSNSGSDGSTGIEVVGNDIVATEGDAIEHNHPNANTSDILTALNLLSAGEPGGIGGVSSGFGIGIAGSQYHLTIGNIIRKSRQEGIHLEDSHKGGVVVGNVGHSIGEHGILLLPAKATDGEQDGSVISSNHVTHDDVQPNAGHHGIYTVYNTDGASSKNTIIANYIKGFENGLNIGGAGSRNIATGNCIDNCTVALKVTNNSHVEGVNLAANCPTLAKLGKNAIAGKVISDSEITKVVEYTGTASVGAVLKGFAFPLSVTLAGGSTEWKKITETPKRAHGRLILIGEGANGSIFYSTELLWDGTTLTKSNTVKNVNGGLSGIDIRENAGNLEFSIYSSAAITFKVNVDFEGVHYVSV